MTPSDYIKNARATDHDVDGYLHMSNRCAMDSRLIHYVLGVGTESGELQDAVKKWVAYGKEVDRTNVKEEIGDLMWYLSRMCDLFGFTFEEIMDINIKKLQTRYPHKFTQDAALNRDLDKERKVLEGND